MDESLFLKLQSEYNEWLQNNSNSFEDDDDDEEDVDEDDIEEDDFSYSDALIESIYDGNPIALIEAVNSQNSQNILNSLLESSQDIELLDGVDNLGRTALHYATLLGNQSWVSFLVQQGASTEVKDSEGFTPLHFACVKKHTITIIEKLVQSNAPIDAVDLHMRTPLHLACLMENEDAIQLLVMQGANILAQDVSLWTPLHYACTQPNYAIIDFLLDPDIASEDDSDESDDSDDSDDSDESDDSDDSDDSDGTDDGKSHKRKKDKLMGADPNALDLHGRSPFHLALYFCRDDHQRVVNRLLSAGANINLRDGNFRTPLFWCIIGAHSIECMKILLLNGGILNTRDSKGLQPIHWACYFNRAEIIHLLSRNNVDFNCLDNEGRTPLHFGYKHPEVLEILLEHNIQITYDDNHRTALHLSLLEHKIDSFLRIIDHAEKSDINSVDEKGRTYAHYAAMLNSTILLDVLLKRNANLSLKDKIGQNIIHFAAKFGSLEFIKKIQSVERAHKFTSYISGFDQHGRRPMHHAATRNHSDVLQFLIENRSLTRVPDKVGATPLHYACYFGNMSVINILLERGNEINCIDKRGSTPLHCAAASDLIQCYNLIYERSKNKNPIDSSGRSPIFYVRSKSMYDYLSNHFSVHEKDKNGRNILHSAAELNHSSLVIYFLEFQIFHVNSKDNNDVTPLHLAAYYGNDEIVRILLEYNADPLLVDKSNQSALHYAAFSGSLPCLELLFHLSDKTLCCSKGRSAFNVICYQSHFQCLLFYFDQLRNFVRFQEDRSFHDGGDDDEVDEYNNDINAFKYRIKNDYNILQNLEFDFEELLKDDHDLNGRTPLLSFCSSKRIHSLSEKQISIFLQKLLLIYRIGDVDLKGRNALHYAISRKNNRVCVQQLIDLIINNDDETDDDDQSSESFTDDTDDDDNDDDGHSRTRNKNKRFKLINAADHFGITPFMIASFYDDEEIVQFFIEANVDQNQRDHKNRNAKDYLQIKLDREKEEDEDDDEIENEETDKENIAGKTNLRNNSTLYLPVASNVQTKLDDVVLNFDVKKNDIDEKVVNTNSDHHTALPLSVDDNENHDSNNESQASEKKKFNPKDSMEDWVIVSSVSESVSAHTAPTPQNPSISHDGDDEKKEETKTSSSILSSLPSSNNQPSKSEEENNNNELKTLYKQLLENYENQDRRMKNLEKEFYSYKYETSNQLIHQKEEILILKESLYEKETVISELKGNILSLEESKRALNDTIVDLQVQNKTFKFDLSNFTKELNDKNQMIENLNLQTKHLSSENLELREKFSSLKERYEYVVEQSEHLQNQVNQRDKKIEKLENKNEVLKDNEEELMRRLFYNLALTRKTALPPNKQNYVRVYELYEEILNSRLPVNKWENWVANYFDKFNDKKTNSRGNNNNIINNHPRQVHRSSNI